MLTYDKIMPQVKRLLILSSIFFLVQSCEKEVNLSDVTESDFYGEWERHVVNYHDGYDSAHVSIDSLMVLVNSGYELYFNDGNGPDYITFINANPTRVNLESLIDQFFTIYAYNLDSDTVVNRISFLLTEGKHIVRSQNPEFFNDKEYRTYRYPDGSLELQFYREDVNNWNNLLRYFGGEDCMIAEFEKKERFRYCVQDSEYYKLNLEAHKPDGSQVIKVRSLDATNFGDEYFTFVK